MRICLVDSPVVHCLDLPSALLVLSRNLTYSYLQPSSCKIISAYAPDLLKHGSEAMLNLGVGSRLLEGQSFCPGGQFRVAPINWQIIVNQPYRPFCQLLSISFNNQLCFAYFFGGYECWSEKTMINSEIQKTCWIQYVKIHKVYQGQKSQCSNVLIYATGNYLRIAPGPKLLLGKRMSKLKLKRHPFTLLRLRNVFQ